MGSPVRNRPPRGSGRGDPYGPAGTGSGPGKGPSKGRDRSAARLRAEAPGTRETPLTRNVGQMADYDARRVFFLRTTLRVGFGSSSTSSPSTISPSGSDSSDLGVHEAVFACPPLHNIDTGIRRKDVRTTARRNVAGPRRERRARIGTSCPQHAIMRRCFKLPEQERHWARSAAAS